MIDMSKAFDLVDHRCYWTNWKLINVVHKLYPIVRVWNSRQNVAITVQQLFLHGELCQSQWVIQSEL